MNKEEILARSRKENNDEGFRIAEDKGRKIGITAFLFVFLFIIFFNLFSGRDNYAPLAMFWAFISAEAYPKYRFTKNKVYLITTIAGAISSIANLVNFVIAVLR